MKDRKLTEKEIKTKSGNGLGLGGVQKSEIQAIGTEAKETAGAAYSALW